MCGRSRPCGLGSSRAGALGEAQGWARERGLSAEDDLSYLHEFEHITLARVLMAHYTAREQTARSRSDATPGAPPACGGGRRGSGSVIEILVLQALAHQLQATFLLRLRHCNAR